VVYPVVPGTSFEVAYMESGRLVVTPNAAVTVSALGDTQSGGEVIPAGTEFTLEIGRFVVIQPSVTGAVRNDGGDTADLLQDLGLPSIPATPVD
jgi:hypothetical protein